MLDYRKHIFCFFSCFACLACSFLPAIDFACDDSQSNLMEDLLVVDYWNKRHNERLPVTFNNLLQGGYFSMPSARMGAEGEVGAGYSWVPPYYTYNLRVQLVDFLEITGNYRIFRGVDDPVLTPMGFGDFSDKGANVKLSLFSPEASHYKLPGVAIGMEDFMGTQAFKAYYIVLTQVLLDNDLEISLGYGAHRIHKWFGGMTWFPFRKLCWSYLQSLAFVLEYDAIPYEDETYERHPKGRVKHTPWNIGVKYRLWDSIDLSLSYIRGDAVAFTASSFFNFGSTKGMLPKLADPMPYKAPVNTQALGCLRPEDVMIQDFSFAMREQGFDLVEAWLSYEDESTVLRLKIVNMVYREERLLRDRFNALLVALTPENIDKVIIVIDAVPALIQEYHYNMSFVRLFQVQAIGRYELNILTPVCEVSYPNVFESKLLFKKKREWLNLELLPKTHTLFGSSRGKFKYALGLTLAVNGFLPENIYYSIKFGYFIFSNLHDIHSVDRLNPSQLINVRTDIITYFQQKSITVDEAYVEKVWNWGRGWYTRLTLGLLEQEYGGVGGEWLYYPVNSSWAIGMDFAILKKRTPEGIGFTNRVRQLHGFEPHYVKFIGSQYFLNLYYDWKCTALEFKISAGKFLADDVGVRTEISRYFPSGLKIGFWYTYTNGNDVINGQTYHDKGLYFSMPLDIFYTKSSRTRWGYGMSAWLRDVGVRAYTGTELYQLINQNRQ
ncbi:YjbH domain-containing protein [Candidatus Protochlamydia naegleriophila]|nr:YjbH domain-containing protein [Candidatus Protochlamydia naegleriophila]